MKSNDLKKLSRSDLIDIIYQLQLNEKKLNDQIDALKKELLEKEAHIASKLSGADSIADAVVGLSSLFEAAQKTAEQYLTEVKSLVSSGRVASSASEAEHPTQPFAAVTEPPAFADSTRTETVKQTNLAPDTGRQSQTEPAACSGSTILKALSAHDEGTSLNSPSAPPAHQTVSPAVDSAGQPDDVPQAEAATSRRSSRAAPERIHAAISRPSRLRGKSTDEEAAAVPQRDSESLKRPSDAHRLRLGSYYKLESYD